MAHVFISYSSRHRELTRQLAERLVAEGYPVWWDHALESWGAYEPQIRAALDAASAVVVIWSAGAAASRFVKAEVEKALRLGKLVNLRAPDFPLAEVPLNYAAVDHIQTLDLADLKPVLRTLQTVWQGKVPPGARPMHETYRDLYGEDLFDPRRRDLPEDPAMVTPSVLLQAPYEVAGYADANGALADMLDWCTGRGAYLDATRPSAGRLAHGPGGMGKTRLMIETVRRLRAEGWLAGFYPAAVPNEAARMKHRQHAIEQVMSGGPEPGVLMVLDYAESRWADVIGLARMASQRPRDSGRPLRIVLLSRGAAWWQDLYRTEPEVQVLFNRRGAPHGDIRESGALPTGDERLQVFDAMRAALTPLLVHQAGAGLFPPLQQGPLPGDRRARLAEGAAFARPLALQMEALLSLAGSAGEEVADLLESVLALERRHWRKVIDGLAPGDRREGAMRRGISQITALGGTADRPGTERLLAADSYFGTRARVDLPMAELRRLYAAGSEGVAALEPDLIGEHELLLSGDEALLDACRDWIAALPEPDRAARRRTLFTVLHRATRAEHGARAAGAEAFLAHAVAGMTTGEAPALVAAAIETPGPLPRLLTEAVPRLPAEVLEALAKAMPAQTVALLGLADAVAGQRLNAARARMDAEAGSEQAHADLARCLANRGKTLQGLGQREAALAATEEAVAIRRRLAAARPDEFEPDLARSLNNLGVDLSNLGQREAALVATEEAMAIRRRLAAARPDAFEPDLAVSLSNLGVDLSSLGQREAALEATENAVEVTRRLAAARPNAFEPDLAVNLSNLGARLSGLGQREAALEATKEAVEITRRLATARPDAFEPDLARSLNNLGAEFYDLGQHEAALAATEEAVAITRRLAAARPDAFEPNLATILTNLGGQLSILGQRESALAATEEAVEIRRRLAAARPDTFEAALARSLNNLGNGLSNLRQREAALAATKEAVAIDRRLAAARPDAFEPDLARSLNNLGSRLANLGQHEAALAAKEEAVAIRRRLAAARPDAFEPDLAVSLGGMSEILLTLDRKAGALAAAGEGIALLLPHHTRLPAAHQELKDELHATLAKAHADRDETGGPP